MVFELVYLEKGDSRDWCQCCWFKFVGFWPSQIIEVTLLLYA